MIKKLRIQFIVINMLMALLVITASFGIVCYVQYSSSLDRLYSGLKAEITRVIRASLPQLQAQHIIESNNLETNSFLNDMLSSPSTEETGVSSTGSQSADGTQSASSGTPTTGFDAGARPSNNAEESIIASNTSPFLALQDNISSATGSASNAEVTAPQIGDRELENASTLPVVAVYLVSENGIYTTVPEFSSASISESVLLRANNNALRNPNNEGYIEELGLCYVKAPSDTGFLIAYTDARSVSEWRSLALTLVWVGLAALLVFFLINIFFSRWALKPVEEAMRRQRQFTADASHELKTPLTVIMANMAILKSQPELPVEEQMQWVDGSTTEAERMLLLVNDMLDLARPEEESVRSNTVQREKIDLSDLVEGEALQFESVAFERGVFLESEIQEGVFVLGNTDRLGRMVATLIDNACKYSGEGGSVKVKLTEENTSGLAPDTAIITVSNTGSKISDEDLPHIFDRFYRADKARTSGKGGYGLGLAIGREIARQHNGDIEVKSTDEETVFTITLPAVH